MWAAISIIGMLFLQPTDPGKANPHTNVQLQQFSWTEATLEASIQVSVSAAGTGQAGESLEGGALRVMRALRHALRTHAIAPEAVSAMQLHCA